MRISIVDDNKLITDGMKAMLLKCDTYKEIINEELEIDVCYSSKDFFQLPNKKDIDLCFLDINLEEESINGLGLAKYIKKTNHRILLIFISSFDDYYCDMVQVEPFRFLHKPFMPEDLYRVFIEACERILLEKESKTSFLYKYTYNGIIHSVDLSCIKYIYSLKRKIYLVRGFVDDEKEINEFYGKLDLVEKEINELVDFFIRINKSILVNKYYIESYGKNEIYIDNEKLSISPKYKKEVWEKLKLWHIFYKSLHPYLKIFFMRYTIYNKWILYGME